MHNEDPNNPFSIEAYVQKAESNQRKLKLTQEVVEEVHRSLVNPMTTEERADLLVQAEDLTESTFNLLHSIRGMVWEAQPKKEIPEIEEDH